MPDILTPQADSPFRYEQVKAREENLKELALTQVTESCRNATKRCEVYQRAEIIPFESAT